MDSISACIRGEIARAAKAPVMVFDWHKAARLIAEKKPKAAQAGLSGDWEWTGGEIYRDGHPVTTDYTYLASTWATPELEMDGDVVKCFIMETESPGGAWNADTKWPKTALDILAILTGGNQS